jgi:endonuclease/exonuclease/phosphatase family metal-dependent hydrolase
MRLATFNLESLDLPPKAGVSLEARAEVMRPALARLQADVVCFQEVNGQHLRGHPGRALVALEKLLAGTGYEGFHRAASTGSSGMGVADVHNLVTLSRYPILASHEIRHQHVPELRHDVIAGPPGAARELAIRFDRPLLVTKLDIGGGRVLTVVNLHLRAPLAANLPGQKCAPFVWKSVAGWAEGYFLSAMARSAQALELRLAVEQWLDEDPRALIAAAGDYNAEDHETPLKIVVGAEEDTGNGDLTARSLVVLDRAISADRRWSVLHHGRPQMLDHILASRALHGHFRGIEVHNETLADEAVSYAKVDNPPGSYHAAVVAELAL